MKKFFKISGEILIYIGIYLVAQVLLASLLSVFYGIWSAIGNQVMDPGKLQTFLNRNTLYIIFGSILLSFFVYFLIFKAKKEDFIECCNFSLIRKSNIGLIVLLGITFNFSLSMINQATSLYKLFPDHQKLMEQLVGGSFGPTLLIAGIVAPIFEEILFRGIIFNKLRNHISLTMAILTQGVIFGIYHQNFLQGIYSTILGVLAALIYIWFNSIWAPISVHVAFNTLSVIMSRIANQSFLFSHWIEMLLFSGLILMFTIYLLWKNRIRTVTMISSFK